MSAGVRLINWGNKRDAIVAIVEAVKAYSGDAARLKWNGFFRAHPEVFQALEFPVGTSPQRQLSSVRDYVRYNKLAPIKAHKPKEPKGDINDPAWRKARATHAAQVKQAKRLVALQTNHIPEPSKPFLPVEAESPISFCPVCGSDLRACRAKARIS